MLENCGNNVVDPGEACDDGNQDQAIVVRTYVNLPFAAMGIAVDRQEGQQGYEVR